MDYNKLKDYLGNQDHFIKEIGIEIDSIREGFAQTRLIHTDRHRNANGVVNGGALYTLADFTGVCAASSYGYRITTLNGTVNYLKPVRMNDKVIAVGRTTKYGNRIINITVDLFNDDGVIFMQSDLLFYNLGIKLELNEYEL